MRNSPALDDASVERFVSAADHIDAISSPTLRANALGAFQADVGLWQILARQGQIPIAQLNATWQGAVQPFIGVGSSPQLFEAARSSLQSTFKAAGATGPLTQDQIVDVLAGPPQDSPDGQRVHQQLAGRIRAVLDDQRLVSLDTLFGLSDGLSQMAKGAHVGDSLLPLAGNLREFEMPRPIFTGSERSSWSPVVYTARHAELQVRTDLTRILKSTATPAQLESAKGQLTPFLRDTLVGLNYAYYEPPGAEVLHNNPLFVRSHDFSSVSVQGFEQIWGMPELIGVGATAGGGAYLMGSLADLPYALASTEEDFIAPRNVQALIWKEVVPDLLVGAILPRWWTVNRNEMHAAGLYQRAGEELIAASGGNAGTEGEGARHSFGPHAARPHGAYGARFEEPGGRTQGGYRNPARRRVLSCRRIPQEIPGSGCDVGPRWSGTRGSCQKVSRRRESRSPGRETSARLTPSW